MITRKQFESVGKGKVRYLALFDFFKKNKNTAYTAKDLLEELYPEIGLKKGQLGYCLGAWKSIGYLKHNRPHYIITEEGLKHSGRVELSEGGEKYISKD